MEVREIRLNRRVWKLEQRFFMRRMKLSISARKLIGSLRWKRWWEIFGQFWRIWSTLTKKEEHERQFEELKFEIRCEWARRVWLIRRRVMRTRTILKELILYGEVYSWFDIARDRCRVKKRKTYNKVLNQKREVKSYKKCVEQK